MSLSTQIAKAFASQAKLELFQAEKNEVAAAYLERQAAVEVENAKSMLKLALEKHEKARENVVVCKSDVKLASDNFKRRREEFLEDLVRTGEEASAAKYPKLGEDVVYLHNLYDTPSYNPASPDHSRSCSPFGTPVPNPTTPMSPLSP